MKSIVVAACLFLCVAFGQIQEFPVQHQCPGSNSGSPFYTLTQYNSCSFSQSTRPINLRDAFDYRADCVQWLVDIHGFTAQDATASCKAAAEHYECMAYWAYCANPRTGLAYSVPCTVCAAINGSKCLRDPLALPGGTYKRDVQGDDELVDYTLAWHPMKQESSRYARGKTTTTTTGTPRPTTPAPAPTTQIPSCGTWPASIPLATCYLSFSAEDPNTYTPVYESYTSYSWDQVQPQFDDSKIFSDFSMGNLASWLAVNQRTYGPMVDVPSANREAVSNTLAAQVACAGKKFNNGVFCKKFVPNGCSTFCANTVC